MQHTIIAKTTYSAQSIKAMTQANYHLYQASVLRKIYGAGIFLFLAGQLFSAAGQDTLCLLLMLVGCIVIANGEFPAHQAAKAILGQLNGKYPKIQMAFSPEHIRVTLDKDSQVLEYSRIEKMTENRDCFFLFLGPGVAYVVDKEGFFQGTALDFRKMIVQKTGLQFESTALMRSIFPSRRRGKR